MSKLAELIDPEVAEKMKAVATTTVIAADVQADQPAQTKTKTKVRHGSQPIVSTTLPSGTRVDRVLPARHHERCKCKSCGYGSSVAMTQDDYEAKYGLRIEATPRKLTQADTIQAKYDIDPESHALIEVECVDCKGPVNIDPTDPTVRAACCADCTKVRMVHAIAEQRQVEIVRRDKTTITIDPKEQDMDLDNMSDAEIGATVRRDLKEAKAEKIKAAKPEVEKARRKDDKASKKARKERHAIHKIVLRSFMVGTTLEVPDLDLGIPSSLDEAPSAKERSPYNKARFRLFNEAPLDPEATTYHTLRAEHSRLQQAEFERIAEKLKAEAAKPKPKTKVKKAKTKKVEVVAADVSADQVAVLVKTLNVSEKKARKILASM